ncbi:MAG TPA: hypothetical protein ENK32_00715, partial [Anaerolineae bacterium]|nr:hypothetical protein [Anaerolineae bacterium]
APSVTPPPLPDFANAGPLTLTRAGRMGQPLEQFAAYDDFVYAAAGMELLTVDFRDPANPRQASALSLPGLEVLQMAVDGRTLLIGTNPYETVDIAPYGVLLLDLSAPDAPRLAGQIELESARPGSFAANGYYFALTGDGLYFPVELWVYAIADPAAPQKIAAYPLSDLVGEDLAPDTRLSFADGIVYLSVGGQTWTLDAANPAAPPQPAAAPPPSPAPPEPPRYRLQPDALQQIEQTDSDNPVVTGEFRRPVFAAYDMAVIDDFLYVVSDGNELLALDVSDPAAPQINQTVSGPVERLFTLGPWLGGLERPSGAATRLHLWDTAAAPDLVPVSVTELPLTKGSIQDVALANGRLHIATITGLTVIDITDLAAPQAMALWPAPERVNGLTAVDDTVYLATDNGLRILDVSDPAAPQERGAISFFTDTFHCDPAAAPAPDPLALTDAFRVGEYVYTASFLGCLAVIDVTDPARPELAAMTPFIFDSYVNINLWQNRLIGFADYVSLDTLQKITLLGWNSDQDTITPIQAG